MSRRRIEASLGGRGAGHEGGGGRGEGVGFNGGLTLSTLVYFFSTCGGGGREGGELNSEVFLPYFDPCTEEEERFAVLVSVDLYGLTEGSLSACLNGLLITVYTSDL